MHHLLHPPDQRPHHLCGHPLASHRLQDRRRQRLEGIGHAVEQRDRLAPARVDLDDAHRRRRRLRGDPLDQLFERPLRELRVAPRLAVRQERLRRRLQRRPDERLDRRQEAGLFVVEMLVERTAGHPGDLDQVHDRRRLIALFGDVRHHRAVEAFTVVLLRFRRSRAPARGQRLLAQLLRVSPGCRHHPERHHIQTSGCPRWAGFLASSAVIS